MRWDVLLRSTTSNMFLNTFSFALRLLLKKFALCIISYCVQASHQQSFAIFRDHPSIFLEFLTLGISMSTPNTTFFVNNGFVNTQWGESVFLQISTYLKIAYFLKQHLNSKNWKFKYWKAKQTFGSVYGGVQKKWLTLLLLRNLHLHIGQKNSIINTLMLASFFSPKL